MKTAGVLYTSRQDSINKAEELGLIGLIEDVVSEKERKAIIKKLAEKAKEGSFSHLQLFMAYYYGKPTEYARVEEEQIGLQFILTAGKEPNEVE